MRIAVLSDVHGNATALDACLAQLDRLGVDERVFIGDAVGYLPDAAGCLERLQAEGFTCQQGNHEAMLLDPDGVDPRREAVYRLADARAQVSGALRAEIAAWPASRAVERDGRRLLFVHGAPADPLEGYVYPDADLSGWDALPHDAVFMGHTHRPFAARRGPVLIVNTGSVGLPRDVGRLASFAVYDTETAESRHYRVAFDVDDVLRRAGEQLHPATRECLGRDAARFVGEVIG
jgi:predicted phosphodiesterase